jgi:hypothetical protein
MNLKSKLLSLAFLALAAPALAQTMPNGGGGGAAPGTFVSSFSAGTTGLTPSSPTTGDVVLSGTLTPTNGGTGINALGTGVATALGQNVSGTGAICLASGSACGGGSGTVTSITGGNGILPSTNPCTSTCTLNTTVTRNNQTGTSYALASTDGGKIVTGSQAGAMSYTIVQATTTGFTAGYGSTVANINAAGGTNLTLTATTSTFGNGLTSVVLAPGQVMDFASDGTNYPFTAVSLPVMAQDTVLGNPNTANYPSAMAIPACANDGAHGLVYASHAFACASITGGGGSGTVNSGTAGSLAYYATSTNAVSDAGTAQVNVGGVNIASATVTGIVNGLALKTTNNVQMLANSTEIMQWGSTLISTFKNLQDTNSAGYQINTGATSATGPVFAPNRGSTSSGIGAQASGNVSVIASGTEILRAVSTGPMAITIPTDATHTDATICRDTTTGALLTGTGTAGICLGTSSARFKHGIADLRPGLAEILQLKPISYYLNKDHGDPKKQLYGFTAEDMVKVLPKLVDKDGTGKPNTADYLGVLPVLVRAVQQQQEEIAGLKKQLASRR